MKNEKEAANKSCSATPGPCPLQIIPENPDPAVLIHKIGTYSTVRFNTFTGLYIVSSPEVKKSLSPSPWGELNVQDKAITICLCE